MILLAAICVSFHLKIKTPSGFSTRIHSSSLASNLFPSWRITYHIYAPCSCLLQGEQDAGDQTQQAETSHPQRAYFGSHQPHPDVLLNSVRRIVCIFIPDVHEHSQRVLLVKPHHARSAASIQYQLIRFHSFICRIVKHVLFFAPVSVSLRNNAFAFTGFLVNFIGNKPFNQILSLWIPVKNF